MVAETTVITESITLSESFGAWENLNSEQLGIVEALESKAMPWTLKPRPVPHFIFKIAGVEIPIKDFSITRTLSRGVTGKATTWDVYASHEDIGNDVELIFKDPTDNQQITVFKGRVTAYGERPPSKLISLELG